MPRPIVDTLRAVRQGAMLDEAAEKLNEVVCSVRETGRAATLIVELTVSRTTRDGNTITIADKVTAKLPKSAAGETVEALDLLRSRADECPKKDHAKITSAIGERVKALQA